MSGMMILPRQLFFENIVIDFINKQAIFSPLKYQSGNCYQTRLILQALRDIFVFKLQNLVIIQTLIMSKKVKIAHSLDELEDQIILTLVDKPILNQGNLDDDEVDILQNDQIQTANQAKHNVELKSKLKNIADASSSHLEAKNEGLSGILPHYDDYSYKPSTIEVSQGAVIKARKNKKSKALGSDYQQGEVTTTKLNSQYALKKNGKKSNNKPSARDLLNFLDETAEDNLSVVKKEDQNQDIIQDSLDQLKKKRILQNSIKNIVKDVVIDDEQESLLLKSIERSRKKAENNQNKYNILDIIKEEDVDHPESQGGKVQIELNPIAYRSSESARQDKSVNLRDAVGGTSSVMFATLPSERLAKKTVQEEQKLKFEDFSKEELQKMRAQVQFLQDKEVGIGLAGTLAYLRENSLLGQQEQVGRHNDKSVSYNDPNDRIRLQYRNASGKLMKPKEAYRYICAKFHGEGASKNKIEIRKRRELEELRVKQNLNEGGKLLKMLEQHQEKTNEAHLVLNIGGKGPKTT